MPVLFGSDIGAATGGLAVNTVETPRPSVWDNAIAYIILGVILAAFGVVALVIVPIAGIGGIVLGILLLAAGFNPVERPDCPKCDGRLSVRRDTARVKCRSCKSEFNVKWTERSKVELPY